MNKRRMGWIVGAMVLTLLVTGVMVFAGNGMGRRAASTAAASTTCQMNRDADGDGIPNCQDADWVAPADGSRCSMLRGSGRMNSGNCAGTASSTCTDQGSQARCGRGCA